MTACLLALDERTRPLAAAAIAVAVIVDTFDGKFARLFTRTPRQARCGMELDSLVDAIAFGAAPLVVLFAAVQPGTPAAVLVYWIASVAYSLAVITRLAFYNVEEDGAGFVGIPSPAAALLCVTAGLVPAPPWFVTTTLILAAVLMVAPLRIPRPSPVGLALFVSWSAAVVIVQLGRYQ